MPIAQILQSLKGTCRFCRRQTSLLKRDHRECRQTHQTGWQEMVQLAAQAASAYTFNEAALGQTSRPSPIAPAPPTKILNAPLRRGSGRASPTR